MARTIRDREEGGEGELYGGHGGQTKTMTHLSCQYAPQVGGTDEHELLRRGKFGGGGRGCIDMVW